MLNRIKDKILHVLRNYCGYYELEEIKGHYQNMCIDYSEDFKRHIKQLNKLSSEHEAKILEYDILDNKYKEVVNLTTNYTLTGDIYNLGNFSSAWSSENRHKYNSYLIAELEEILNIMKQKRYSSTRFDKKNNK